MNTSYETILVLLENRFPLPRDMPDESLLIQRTEVHARESDKIYTTDSLKRIKKDQLLALRASPGGIVFEYEVYCLPGDEERGAELIREQVAKEVSKQYAHLKGILLSTKNGYEILDPHSRIDRHCKKQKR